MARDCFIIHQVSNERHGLTMMITCDVWCVNLSWQFVLSLFVECSVTTLRTSAAGVHAPCSQLLPGSASSICPAHRADVCICTSSDIPNCTTT